ncbi:MAG: HAMP domain-containing protein [Acidobacteria bacterium]|nr:HAMP domain-containing protein [Acidobacteriota bacterium]
MKASNLLDYRKDPRFVITVPLLLFVATSLVYYLMLRARELSPEALTSRLLLFALWNINVILILGILFVLTRNVIKLVLERQRGVAGSRFRTKLVLTYLATALVPIGLLFFVATDLLRVSIDRWFNTPVRTILTNSESIAEQLQSEAIERSRRAATEVGEAVEKGGADRIDAALRHVRATQGVDVAGVYEAGVVLSLLADPRAPVHQMREPTTQFLERIAADGGAFKIEVTPTGKWIRSGRRIDVRGKQLVAIAGVFLTGEIARMVDQNVVAFADFQQLDAQRQALKASQTSMFLTVTLFVLFGTLWISIYVSRRITGPVQALAEGTRTLAGGDYGHRIELRGTDELGQLIESFNSMAEQLEAQRDAVTASNRETEEVNRRLGDERAYLSTILESVSTGILACTDQLELLSINRAALRILQLPAEPAPGARLDEILVGPLTPIGNYLRELLKREPRPREVSLSRGGDILYLEISAAPMTSAEKTIGWVVAIEDSTQLIQAQKLAAWSEAARRIAHEIKNPLTPIRLSADRIRKKFQAGDEGVATVVDEGCRTIVNSVTELQSMVDEFSRFARMPAIHLRMSDVSAILREAAQLYSEVKPGVTLDADIADDLRAVVDPEQIRRAIVNLLDNAVEATEEGAVTLRARLRRKTLRIEVSDTGRGVTAADRERLFLPYYSTKEKGTGLGLAIVLRIVKDHDGRITVHPNQPRGTRFEIEIPA